MIVQHTTASLALAFSLSKNGAGDLKQALLFTVAVRLSTALGFQCAEDGIVVPLTRVRNSTNPQTAGGVRIAGAAGAHVRERSANARKWLHRIVAENAGRVGIRSSNDQGKCRGDEQERCMGECMVGKVEADQTCPSCDFLKAVSPIIFLLSSCLLKQVWCRLPFATLDFLCRLDSHYLLLTSTSRLSPCGCARGSCLSTTSRTAGCFCRCRCCSSLHRSLLASAVCTLDWSFPLLTPSRYSFGCLAHSQAYIHSSRAHRIIVSSVLTRTQ